MAGVTAAYLVRQWLAPLPCASDVLITLSSNLFRNEGEREVGFRSALRGSGIGVVDVTDSDGIDAANEGLVLDALRRHPAVEAVTQSAVATPRRWAPSSGWGGLCRVFVAHDLDADNRRLLRDGRISVVLHNDLRSDARLALRAILAGVAHCPSNRCGRFRSRW